MKKYDRFESTQSAGLDMMETEIMEPIEKPNKKSKETKPEPKSEGKLSRLIIDRVSSVIEKSKIHYYTPESSLDSIRNQNYGSDESIFYVSTLKSVWDSFIIPSAVTTNRIDGSMPLVMMSTNLMSNMKLTREWIKRQLFENSRILLVDKNSNKMHYRQMIKTIDDTLSNNESLLTFPEGSRSRTGLVGDFDPSVFVGAIEASKKKTVKIIPVNVDYSKVLELSHLIKGTNYISSLYTGITTLNKVELGNVYLTLGRPITVSPDMTFENDSKYDKKTPLRERLADNVRNYCLDLVKIQPINVVSEAINRMNVKPKDRIRLYGSKFENSKFEDVLESVVDDLRENIYNSSKFREFNKLSPSVDLILESGIPTRDGEIIVTEKLLNESKIYANYIRHYFMK
ncbi:MAG TPA: 1-acyl-sn-glycerol-3-phosphate acyltransferase [Alphaproteobacteria bacterium]|nr:1-acyl-sn-glycerol-3-phosphate acyltransferase [Alphaproteobacteria bacterium]